MAETPTLKPCAFCGQPAPLIEHYKMAGYSMQCLTTACRVIVFGDSPDDIAARWNTREDADASLTAEPGFHVPFARAVEMGNRAMAAVQGGETADTRALRRDPFGLGYTRHDDGLHVHYPKRAADGSTEFGAGMAFDAREEIARAPDSARAVLWREMLAAPTGFVAPPCNHVTEWKCVGQPTYCGAPAEWRYPAMGGGYGELCAEHATAAIRRHSEYIAGPARPSTGAQP